MRNIFHDGSSQKMLLTRDIAYTLSTDGYSLQKSGVSQVGRCSLKWSRSMQRRSKVVNKVSDTIRTLSVFLFSTKFSNCSLCMNCGILVVTWLVQVKSVIFCEHLVWTLFYVTNVLNL